MVGVIVISESKSAEELLKTVQHVLGKGMVKGMEAIRIKSAFSHRTLKAKLNSVINKLNADKGVLILSELHGATQSNICHDFLQGGTIELVTGYNLPMLIKAATLNQKTTLKDLCSKICESGKTYIQSIK